MFLRWLIDRIWGVSDVSDTRGLTIVGSSDTRGLIVSDVVCRDYSDMVCLSGEGVRMCRESGASDVLVVIVGVLDGVIDYSCDDCDYLIGNLAGFGAFEEFRWGGGGVLLFEDGRVAVMERRYHSYGDGWDCCFVGFVGEAECVGGVVRAFWGVVFPGVSMPEVLFGV